MAALHADLYHDANDFFGSQAAANGAAATEAAATEAVATETAATATAAINPAAMGPAAIASVAIVAAIVAFEKLPLAASFPYLSLFEIAAIVVQECLILKAAALQKNLLDFFGVPRDLS